MLEVDQNGNEPQIITQIDETLRDEGGDPSKPQTIHGENQIRNPASTGFLPIAGTSMIRMSGRIRLAASRA
jgi:hypothetical protein